MCAPSHPVVGYRGAELWWLTMPNIVRTVRALKPATRQPRPLWKLGRPREARELALGYFGAR
jgi:hypothetical protein